VFFCERCALGLAKIKDAIYYPAVHNANLPAQTTHLLFTTQHANDCAAGAKQSAEVLNIAVSLSEAIRRGITRAAPGVTYTLGRSCLNHYLHYPQ